MRKRNHSNFRKLFFFILLLTWVFQIYAQVENSGSSFDLSAKKFKLNSIINNSVNRLLTKNSNARLIDPNIRLSCDDHKNAGCLSKIAAIDSALNLNDFSAMKVMSRVSCKEEDISNQLLHNFIPSVNNCNLLFSCLTKNQNDQLGCTTPSKESLEKIMSSKEYNNKLKEALLRNLITSQDVVNRDAGAKILAKTWGVQFPKSCQESLEPKNLICSNKELDSLSEVVPNLIDHLSEEQGSLKDSDRETFKKLSEEKDLKKILRTARELHVNYLVEEGHNGIESEVKDFVEDVRKAIHFENTKKAENILTYLKKIRKEKRGAENFITSSFIDESGENYSDFVKMLGSFSNDKIKNDLASPKKGIEILERELKNIVEKKLNENCESTSEKNIRYKLQVVCDVVSGEYFDRPILLDSGLVGFGSNSTFGNFPIRFLKTNRERQAFMSHLCLNTAKICDSKDLAVLTSRYYKLKCPQLSDEREARIRDAQERSRSRSALFSHVLTPQKIDSEQFFRISDVKIEQPTEVKPVAATNTANPSTSINTNTALFPNKANEAATATHGNQPSSPKENDSYDTGFPFDSSTTASSIRGDKRVGDVERSVPSAKLTEENKKIADLQSELEKLREQMNKSQSGKVAESSGDNASSIAHQIESVNAQIAAAKNTNYSNKKAEKNREITSSEEEGELDKEADIKRRSPNSAFDGDNEPDAFNDRSDVAGSSFNRGSSRLTGAEKNAAKDSSGTGLTLNTKTFEGIKLLSSNISEENLIKEILKNNGASIYLDNEDGSITEVIPMLDELTKKIVLDEKGKPKTTIKIISKADVLKMKIAKAKKSDGGRAPATVNDRRAKEVRSDDPTRLEQLRKALLENRAKK